jgi:N-acetylneuraminic acid mutarotase
MSDFSRKRSLFAVLLTTFIAPALFAGYPSPRYETRMVYNSATHRFVLFGGSTAVDPATKLAYELNDTWEFVNNRWVEQFPLHRPPGRRAHVMVYDSVRDRIVVFGGRNKTTDLNDTWIYKNGDWAQLTPATSPSQRVIAGGAYDVDRDRIVVFGGTQISADAKTSTPLYDTWEFDGTNWKQTNADGPKVTKPLLEYDAARKTMIMLGIDDKSATAMYAYDSAKSTWSAVTAATLPPCINEGFMAYQTSTNTIVYSGGICSDSSALDDTYEWDGATWNKVTLAVAQPRYSGAAFAYDRERNLNLVFGGSTTTGVPSASTFVYANTTWVTIFDPILPSPRSLFSFTTDPKLSSILLYGGVNELEGFEDYWRYTNGDWTPLTVTVPTNCLDPNAAYDTDRGKLVMLCSTSATWEWDGAAWTEITTKTQPTNRQFSQMVYDANIKKTVLFGGYNSNYIDQTWTWDGTLWTRVKNNPAPSRALATMWYDPLMKKTVMYGGVGRLSSEDRITRYSDMWTFDGSGWTELKPAGATPGTRYGALSAVDPRTGKLMLFGGLRLDLEGTVQKQVFVNDQWEWDGSKQTWTKITTATVPPARENGGIAYDPLRDEMVMFGGYAGYYLSDVWAFKNGDWSPRAPIVTPRRRSVR